LVFVDDTDKFSEHISGIIVGERFGEEINSARCLRNVLTVIPAQADFRNARENE
jgi:hypothetical protein